MTNKKSTTKVFLQCKQRYDSERRQKYFIPEVHTVIQRDKTIDHKLITSPMIVDKIIPSEDYN